MGKLAASILSADLAHLGDQVKLIDEYAEVIHVDIMDGHFVPPIALGTVVVTSLRKVTDRVLHGHLMVDTPAQYFDELAEAGLDMVSFHVEAQDDPTPVMAHARRAGLGLGLVANMESDLSQTVFPYLDEIDDVMLMSIKPGWSGQQLQPEVYSRLETVRKELDRRGLSASLEVDGGVKIDNAKRAVEAGATVLISASGLFQQPDPTDAARRIYEVVKDA